VLSLTNDTVICAGNSTILSANGSTGNIVWNTGGTGLVISVTPNNNTYYTAAATLNGCQKTDSILVTVLQHTDSDILIDRSDSCNGNVQFKCINNTAINQWHFSNGISITNNCYVILPFEKGTYQVTNIVNPNTDCADTTVHSFSVYLSVTGNVKEVPNTFTPNNDGVNDRFYFSNLTRCDEYDLKIYNRWGSLIFSSDGRQNFWDGRTTSGEIATDGNYFYIINEKEKSYKGSITLFR